MSWKNIDLKLLATVINDLPERFATRDVSEDSRMLTGHPGLCGARNYHAWVGRCISANNGAGGVPALRRGGSSPRGQQWIRTEAGAERPPEQGTGKEAKSAGPTATDDLGPQCASDKPFTAAMRLHQSRYRRDVLKVPCGTGPGPKARSFYGNMLPAEHGARGANFLTSEIFDVVQRRLDQGTDRVEPFRLLHNMLSSQPMCFNLFGPLVLDRDLARRLMEPLLGELASVDEVRIEFSPEPAAEYLDDRTSFDAFVAYTRPDGRRGFVGIETKLTEPFSQRHVDKPSYRRWMTKDAPWTDEANARVDAVAHNQLWRDHLLTVALREHTQTPYAEGHLMLVRHPGDTQCARIVEGYRELLREDDRTFIDMPLDRLLDSWGEVHGQDSSWLSLFRQRYLPDEGKRRL